MAKTDLILLHAPSVYDFRERPILFGPVSDVVPSTQIFEMYPIGFMTMLQYLEQNGFRVRIINVALKMLNSRRFNAEKLIRKLKPVAFGIDLHWMVHAQGSLELARLCKEHHPDIPVIFGGLSASFFHEELIEKPEVDYVLRGDSVEEPLRQLMKSIRQTRVPEHVPNLTWKHHGEPRINENMHVPETLDEVSFDYRSIMRASARAALGHFDFLGHIPFKQWLKYPIVAALTCRGCVHNCVVCGGSSRAYQNICGREKPAYRSPSLLAEDIATIGRCIKGPVIVLGDLLQGGRERAEEFLRCLKKERVTNHVAFEFFAPPPDDFVDMIADTVPNYNIQISPESHDEGIRKAFGRKYTNASLEHFIAHALDAGCARIDLFFMIGIPEQTPASVHDTVAYCDTLLEQYGSGANTGRVRPFISPLAPFLDPGSRAFLIPGKHGYKLFARTLDEHVAALCEPSWKLTLNYETKWMTRDDIAESTYDAALELNRVKRRHGLLTDKQADAIDARIASERELMHAIDKLHHEGDQEGLEELMQAYDRFGAATICKKDEMNWPKRLLPFRPIRMLRGILSGGRKARKQEKKP